MKVCTVSLGSHKASAQEAETHCLPHMHWSLGHATDSKKPLLLTQLFHFAGEMQLGGPC